MFSSLTTPTEVFIGDIHDKTIWFTMVMLVSTHAAAPSKSDHSEIDQIWLIWQNGVRLPG